MLRFPHLISSRMKPLLFLWITFLFSINIIPASVSVDNFNEYTNCKKNFSCGDEVSDVKFPFWGGGRGVNCGWPDLELTCNSDGITRFIFNSVKYRILSFDSSTQNLRVARDDYFLTVCPSDYKNTTFDPAVFRYRGRIVNMTLLYGCPSPLSLPFQHVSCDIQNGSSDNVYYAADELVHIDGCKSHVIIPISEANVNSYAWGQISLQGALAGGFSLQWVVGKDECNACINSGGECGYERGRFVCFGEDGGYITPYTHRYLIEKRALFILLVSFIAILILIGNIIRRKARGIENDQHIVEFIRSQEAMVTKKYSYLDVKKMTNKFANKLGQGGYGSVYKGKLSDGRHVAVKLLSESSRYGEEFMNEVASISRTSHINVVSLLGYCYEGSKRALIYEFVSNGSLDKFIYNQETSNRKNSLDWKTLYEIAVGIAQGLEYLHRGCNIRILHFDIKPHNILLDDKFCPKISDFGLAKLCSRDKSAISMLGARGTIGYIAPEVFSRNFGRISYKSDVYSYGMMVFEMVGARNGTDFGVSRTSSEVYFPNHLYKSLEGGHSLKVDGVTNEEEENIFKKMVLVSLWCIQTNPSDRPSMTKVLEMLEGSLQSMPFPPLPFLSSPPKSLPESNESYSTTS